MYINYSCACVYFRARVLAFWRSAFAQSVNTNNVREWHCRRRRWRQLFGRTSHTARSGWLFEWLADYVGWADWLAHRLHFGVHFDVRGQSQCNDSQQVKERQNIRSTYVCVVHCISDWREWDVDVRSRKLVEYSTFRVSSFVSSVRNRPVLAIPSGKITTIHKRYSQWYIWFMCPPHIEVHPHGEWTWW